MTRRLPDTVQVAGRSVLAVMGGMAGVKLVAERVMSRNGLSNVTPDGWYPVARLLAVFDEVEARVGPATLRGIGKEIPRNASFPADIDTLEKALASIDVAYRMNHRGAYSGVLGSYQLTSFTPGRATLVAQNPYPCELDFGLVESMADRFKPASTTYTHVHHDPMSCRKRGGSSCTYIIEW